MKKTTKVGILGGVFNPVHVGHLNAALSVKTALKLKKVFLVPSYRPPNKDVVGSSVEHRLEMVKTATKSYEPELTYSDLELKRGGTSYTYETLEEFGKEYLPKNIYFIMGADNLPTFHTWKNFEQLLELANFVVTTRPGSSVSFEEISTELEKFVKKTGSKQLKLKTGRTIDLVELEDIDVASAEIRKRLRIGHEVRNMMPPSVLEYIQANKLYQRTYPLVKDYREFSLYCGNKAKDKKALGLKIYDMTSINGYADYSIICSATSTKHASSIADGIVRSAKEDFGLMPIGLEGLREGRWVLIDFGPVVIHVFEDAVRGQYQIEHLWKNCRQLQDEIAQKSTLLEDNVSYN